MRILFLDSLLTVNSGDECPLFDTSSELAASWQKISIVVAKDDIRPPKLEFWPTQVNRYCTAELMIR